MNDGTIGIIVLMTVCIMSATLTHWLIKSTKLATTLSVILSVVIFQIMAYIDSGYLDPFFLIAAVVSAGVALIISAFIGSLFKTSRDKHQNEQRKTT